MEEYLYPIFSTDYDSKRVLETRHLAGENINAIPKWKQSLWDNNSIEPAMLRVPIVLLAFVFLWGINVVILDKFKLPYQSAMSIKSGNV